MGLTDDMVERVAEVLALWHTPNIGLEMRSVEGQEAFKVQARLMIEAMREPSDAMVDAVYAHRPVLDCVRGHDLSGADAKAIFTIMIDAALQREGE